MDKAYFKSIYVGIGERLEKSEEYFEDLSCKELISISEFYPSIIFDKRYGNINTCSKNLKTIIENKYGNISIFYAFKNKFPSSIEEWVSYGNYNVVKMILSRNFEEFRDLLPYKQVFTADLIIEKSYRIVY